METLITPSNIMFVIGIIGVIFSIYKSYAQPQQELEKRQSLDALATEKDKQLADKDLGTKASILAQKELETKALVLAEQVKNKDVENERRFNEMGARLDTAMATAQNHIHTVDVKVDELNKSVGVLTNKITELSTIINERIPKK
jgi:hypothetical protein